MAKKQQTGLLALSAITLAALAVSGIWTALTGTLWHWVPVGIGIFFAVIVLRAINDPQQGL